MEKTMQMIKEDAKNVHLLIAEDDMVMQSLYRHLFEGMFAKLTIKDNGAEALEYFLNENEKPVDLIITDTYMPQMNGKELVQKIRDKDFGVRIIVVTNKEDLNTMRMYILNGVDAILTKPYNEELTMKVLQRTLHYINEKKLLEQYVEQLETMARENIARKSAELQQKKGEPRVPKLQKASCETVKKEEDSLIDKYKIRNSVKDMENVEISEIDLLGRERIEAFREKISDYEFALCRVEENNVPAVNAVIKDVIEGIKEVVIAMNAMGVFPIAASAASHLVEFVETLDVKQLQDAEKRMLFIDVLISMLGDFDKWIYTVFIAQTADNIHYFDASFANTCLELEMIFKANKQPSSDNIEFF